FIAMEMVEGETLQALLGRSGPLPIGRLLDVAVEVADGLAEAHAHRIVHRDLKPQNIMITAQGRTKLLDFGLAIPVPEGGAGGAAPHAPPDSVRPNSARPDSARAGPAPAGPARPGPTTGTHSTGDSGRGGLQGTLPYMSPEQARGLELDARSDLFSFGTVLYEMATGRRPFEAGGGASAPQALPARGTAPPWRPHPALPAGAGRLADQRA